MDLQRSTFDPDAGFASRGDNGLVVEFYNNSVPDPIKSREAGRPVYVDVPYRKSFQPGEARLSTIDRPATAQDRIDYPRQWQAFLEGKNEDVTGSPLSLLFPASPATVTNLNQLGVRTIEQLADLKDSALQEIGLGGREFQSRAKAYLANADDGKGFHDLSSQVDALTLELKKLSDRNTALEAALSHAAEKRRPRKDDAA